MDIDAERPIKMDWSEEGSRRRGATDDTSFTWRHCHIKFFVKVKKLTELARHAKANENDFPGQLILNAI